MELVLTRSYYKGGTNGIIRCEGEELCHTIELPWKNNRPCFSCIPEGFYELKKRYNPHRGEHLLVTGVPGRSLILIHPANNAYSRPFPLYDGGPVDKEHLFFVHRRPDLIEEGTYVVDSIYLGGNFRQAIACINDKTLSESDIRIFTGYCGWEHGQLEAEIEEGCWSVADHSEITW